MKRLLLHLEGAEMLLTVVIMEVVEEVEVQWLRKVQTGNRLPRERRRRRERRGGSATT
jgi:hypothetical protein